MIRREHAKTKLRGLTKHTNNRLAILVSARAVIDSTVDSVGRCEECKFLDDRKDNKLGCLTLQFKVTPNFYCALFKKDRK